MATPDGDRTGIVSKGDESSFAAVLVRFRLEVENISSDGHPLDLENAKVILVNTTGNGGHQ